MRHPQLDAELRDRAAAHALGALSAELARPYEEHLTMCDTCRAEVDSLALLIGRIGLIAAEAEPPVGLKARLLERVRSEGPNATRTALEMQPWKSWVPRPAERDEMTFAFSDEGGWESTAFSGIDVRRLSVDESRRAISMLVRMAPGTSYPPHRHGGPEECFVISGDISVGPVVMRAGDYQRCEIGSIHGVQSTVGGCLLYINSSMDDVLLSV